MKIFNQTDPIPAFAYAAELSVNIGKPSTQGPGRTITRYIVEKYAHPNGANRDPKGYNFAWGVVERWVYDDSTTNREFGGAFV